MKVINFRWISLFEPVDAHHGLRMPAQTKTPPTQKIARSGKSEESRLKAPPDSFRSVEAWIENGLTANEIAVLVQLSVDFLQGGGGLSNKDLRSRFGLSDASLARAIDALLARGFVQQTTPTDDARKRIYSLTLLAVKKSFFPDG